MALIPPVLRARQRCQATYQKAIDQGLSPLIAHVVACRINADIGSLDAIIFPQLKYLDPPALLKNSDKAAVRVAEAIIQKQHIGILTDYDVDGVTSHSIIFRALTEYFEVATTHISHFIGHRMKDGYGVSETLTQRILQQTPRPDVIITADCGSSDQYYINQLQQAGIDVIVTDHHAIPAEGVPSAAYAVINPTQANCDYPDQTIAGCMVAWLFMSHVRQVLVAQQQLAATTPKLLQLLSYVALGTIADCVSMSSSHNNRAVVNVGLQLINQFTEPCWVAMRDLLGQPKPFSVQTLGYQLAPRINARSRMADPYAALHYLLADETEAASKYLALLDEDNKARRNIEREMVSLAKQRALKQSQRMSLIIYLEQGHPGVQGIVASRLVQTFGKPSLILCNNSEEGQLTGSARSIPDLHIREVLQYVADQQEGIMVKFGGHHGAAGLTIYKDQLNAFQQLFEQAVIHQLGQQALKPIILTDGKLAIDLISRQTFDELEKLQPYGREFDPPIFEGEFQIQSIRAVGSPAVHLVLQLRTKINTHRSIWFNALENETHPLPFQVGDQIACAYSLNLNEYRGQQTLQLQLQHVELSHAETSSLEDEDEADRIG